MSIGLRGMHFKVCAVPAKHECRVNPPLVTILTSEALGLDHLTCFEHRVDKQVNAS